MAKGYTQDDLAEKISRTRSLISQIEKTGKVNHYTLQDICQVLDIDPDDLEEIIVQDPPELNTMHELTSLKSENRLLRQEIQTLRELIASQRDLIHLLQEKK